MAEVLCFGEALIDLLAEPGSVPLRFQRFAGGAPANVAVALAKLGTPVSFIGMLSQDAFGDFLLESLKAAGVSTVQTVRTGSANTALAFVTLDASGDRRFTFYRPPAADLLFRTELFQPTAFEQAAAFHCCSNSLTEAPIAAATLAGAKLARKSGALVSFDMNFRPALWAEGVDAHLRIWPLLHEADVVKLSVSELAFLADRMGGEGAAITEIWRGHAQWLLITDGAAPLRHLARESQDSLASFRVECVNATGAGDAFAAGILHNLAGLRAEGLKGFLEDPARVHAVLRFAAACGALAVTRHGAFEAMPSRADVEALLATQP